MKRYSYCIPTYVGAALVIFVGMCLAMPQVSRIAQSRAFRLDILQARVDKNGNSLLDVRLVYSRKNAGILRFLVAPSVAISDESLPWKGFSYLRVWVADENGQSRDLGVYWIESAHPSPVRASTVDDATTLRGEVVLCPVSSGDESDTEKQHVLPETRAIKVCLSVAYLPAVENTARSDSYRSVNFIDLESDWTTAPGTWGLCPTGYTVQP